jgi:hypothetical protein
MATTPEAEPVVSVLFALFDVRGDPAAHLRAWTNDQTLPRQQYQVIVASAAGDPSREAEIQALLGSHDVFVRAPGVSEVGLYDVAAKRATAPWLFVTEAHCLGEPECLAAVARAIDAAPELDVVTAEIPRVAANQAGRLGARWFEHVYDQWSALDWKTLPLAGFAVRREVYERAGGIDPRYDLFCAPLLSARLDQLGARIGAAPDARIVHVQPETYQEHHGHSAHFAAGEFDFRADHDHVFCERYFGHPEAWGNRLRFQPEVARQLVRALLAAAANALARRSDDAWWVLRELSALLPAAVAGVGPHLLRERLAFSASEQLLQRLPLPDSRLYPQYLRAQQRVVRLTQLRWIRDHVGPPDPPARGTGTWSAEAVDGAQVIGAHGLESHDGRWFRWTEPVALLRLAPPAGEHLLTIDTGGLRGRPLDYLRGIYAGGRSLPPDHVHDQDGQLIARLPSEFGERAAATGLSLLTRPLEPRRHGSPDRRRLGMPVFSIELRPAR